MALKRILFLDDDPVFLQMLDELFRRRSGGRWIIHTADTTARALTALQEEAIDLVVIDIQMPVVDGDQFLQLLNRKYPQLRKVVMSGFATPEYRSSCLHNGAELFLEKPRSAEGYETVFSTLDELINLEAREGFRGLLRQVGLPDVLQMECLGRSSSILEVATAQMRGRVYIKEGEIIHAETGECSGTEAFNHLLALRGGDFTLKPYEEPGERTIQGQWEFLVMEAARQRDEAQQEALPPASPEPAPITEPSITELFEHPAEVEPQVVPLRLPSRIAEFVVCSTQGDVLHQWQCKNIDARFKLLELISQKAALLAAELPLGQFDRLEVVGPQSRLVAQIKADRQLLLVAIPATNPEPSLATGGSQ